MAYERIEMKRCRKERPCDYCAQTIKPGELYNMHVIGPASEVWENDHWLRVSECAACAGARIGTPPSKPPRSS